MIKINNLFIASDHAGFKLKEFILNYFKNHNQKIIDLGPLNDSNSLDYPDFGYLMANKINVSHDYGLLICGSGVGISIAANRFSHIRAALCYDIESTKISRQHNDANVLSLAGRKINFNLALKCVDTFLNTKFEGGRHIKRIVKLSKPIIK